MEFSRDEVRRQLAEAEREHADVLPRWREALSRVFDPDADTSPGVKAALVGLPDRRGFLRLGGATVAFSAVLAACGKAKTKQVPVTGTTPSTTPEQATQLFALGQELNVNLLRTAQSIEELAVQTYQKALDSGLVTTTSVADALRLFQAQHRDHAGALATTTEDSGGTPYTQPNSYLDEQVVGPAVAALTDEASVVALALTLETTAAQTYVFATELLSTPELRQTVMRIGGVEARHMAVLFGFQEQPQVPYPFMPRRGHIDEKGFVGAGSFTPKPEQETTTTTTPTTTAR
jgi:rubrerythrin